MDDNKSHKWMHDFNNNPIQNIVMRKMYSTFISAIINILMKCCYLIFSFVIILIWIAWQKKLYYEDDDMWLLFVSVMWRGGCYSSQLYSWIPGQRGQKGQGQYRSNWIRHCLFSFNKKGMLRDLDWLFKVLNNI